MPSCAGWIRHYDRAVPWGELHPIASHRLATLLGCTGAGLLAAGLLAAGCSTPVIVARTRTITVTLTEYRVAPDDIEARSGSLTLIAVNRGRLAHNLAIFDGSRQVQSTRPIHPGASATLMLKLAPGSYTMASTIQSDQTLGERGTLQISRGG